MESYYSSDEEIAWGPLTLREIKKELRKEPRKINRRESDPGCSFFTPSTTFTEENVPETDNKTATSVTSNYYTPDSSLHLSSELSNKNDLFLEELTKVIGGENCNEAESLKPKNDTLMNILQSEENEHLSCLENIQQTLINSTNEYCQDDQGVIISSFIEEISSDESDSVIIISDSTMSDIDSPDKLYKSSTPFVKMEEKLESYDDGIVESLDDEVFTGANKYFCNSVSTSNADSSYLTNKKKSSDHDNTFRTEINELDFTYEEQEHSENTMNTDGENMDHFIENRNIFRRKESHVIPISENNFFLNDKDSSSATESNDLNCTYEEQEHSEDTINKDGEKTDHFIENRNISRGKGSYIISTSDNNSFLDHKDSASSTESNELDFTYEQQEYLEDKKNKDEENNMSTEKESQRKSVSEEDASLCLIEQDMMKICGISISKDSEDTSEGKFDSASGSDDFKLNSPRYGENHLESGGNLPVFNDTMEEMEMALQQGLDYVMPGDDFLPPKLTPQKQESQKTAGTQKLLNVPQHRDKFDYIKSPVGDYIKKKVSHDEKFKLPLKPVKQKAMLNHMKSPLVQSNQFKNIASPIGIYIKNSPGVCFKQNIPAKTVPSLKLATKPNTVNKTKENNLGFPETVYKPAKKVVATSKTKNIVLPSSIQKMVQESVITKHESRIQGNMNKSGVSRKLLEDNLTITDSSVLNQTCEDVSYVNVKQVFIK